MDIHFGALFIPLPLFPIVGGYCIGKRSSKKKKRISGPLCSLGLPMHFSLVCHLIFIPLFPFYLLTMSCVAQKNYHRPISSDEVSDVDENIYFKKVFEKNYVNQGVN